MRCDYRQQLHILSDRTTNSTAHIGSHIGAHGKSNRSTDVTSNTHSDIPTNIIAFVFTVNNANDEAHCRTIFVADIIAQFESDQDSVSCSVCLSVRLADIITHIATISSAHFNTVYCTANSNSYGRTHRRADVYAQRWTHNRTDGSHGCTNIRLLAGRALFLQWPRVLIVCTRWFQ